MRDLSGLIPDYPSGQLQAMPGRRVGPTNPFVEFKNEEIEQSIPDRFEHQVRRYPEHLYGDARILHPGVREGRKGEGRFRRVGWDVYVDPSLREAA